MLSLLIDGGDGATRQVLYNTFLNLEWQVYALGHQIQVWTAETGGAGIPARVKFMNGRSNAR
jgi:hypothetical protein